MRAHQIIVVCLLLGVTGCEAPRVRSVGPSLDQIQATLRLSDSEWNEFILLVTSVGEFTIYDARQMRTGEIDVMLMDPNSDGRNGQPSIVVDRVNGVWTIIRGLDEGLTWRGPFILQ